MSQNESFTYPKIHQRVDGKLELIIYYKGKRMRLQNGQTFEINIKPNSFPEGERLAQCNVLAAQIYSKLMSGYDPFNKANVNRINNLNDCQIIEKVIQIKRAKGLSAHYITQLNYTFRMLKRYLNGPETTPLAIGKLLGNYDCPTSHNNIRRNLIVLFNGARELGWEKYPMRGIRSIKAKARLNKPLLNVPAILKEISQYNENLYLCCLLTYGCLLRPHREVRELKWSDFTDDLSYIRLSGLNITPAKFQVEIRFREGRFRWEYVTIKGTTSYIGNLPVVYEPSFRFKILNARGKPADNNHTIALIKTKAGLAAPIKKLIKYLQTEDGSADDW